MVKLKDDKGHFTFLAKVVGMISATVVVVLALGGAAFEIDERHANTVEVAGQFKAIQDSRQASDLQNQLALIQIRLDILEDRLFRERQQITTSQTYINKLENDIQRLRTQSDQMDELWVKQCLTLLVE